MDERKILFPYNFTHKDRKALDFITRNYGGSDDVSITILHLYPPLPEIITGKDSVMDRMSGSLHYLSARVQEQERKMEEVRQMFLCNGFGSGQVAYLYQPKKGDLAQEICRLIKKEGFGTVVLNRSGRITGFFKASLFNRVVTSVTDVCVMVIT